MDRENIIRMAREAGCIPRRHPAYDNDVQVFATPDVLERFVALVAAAEREKVAAWMIERSYATGHGDTTEDLLKELDWQIDERIAAEREAIAQMIEDAPELVPSAKNDHGGCLVCGFTPKFAASYIRARGQE